MTISMSAAGLRRLAPRTAALMHPRVKIALAVAAIGLLYVVLAHELFTGLGGYWLRDFDESRHIASAMEMLHRGDWLVNTYRGAPDYWNLKPPLSFWAIMLSVQAFGASALSVRLPSALATVLCCAVCTTVSWRWRGPIAATVTTAAFASSIHLVDLHSGRTADPDALFVLFMTLSVFSTVGAIRRPWLLVAATTMFTAAFLTKSYHAVLVLVFATAVLVVFRRTSLLRARHLLVSLLGFAPLLTWAIARYRFDGLDFFRAMVLTDVVARSESEIEGHTGGPDYYLSNLQVTFGPWVLVLGMAVVALASALTWRRIIALVKHSDEARRFVALLGWVVLVFVAFSAVASKLPWYAISALPTLTVLIGVTVAAALARIGRPVGLALVAACLVAGWLGQVTITQQRLTENATAVQLALSQLEQGQLAPGQHIYVDPVLSGWQQSFVALVDMHTTAVTMDGFDAGWRTDPASRPVILVQHGSAAYQAVMAEKPKILVSYLDWSILERTTGPLS